MNYAFTAYEYALKRLKEQVDRECPNCANDFLALQTRLLENIARELKSTDGDIKGQRAERRHILTELNILTRQIERISFIELCVENDLLFTYLATVKSIVHYAHETFSVQKPIWPDQCIYIVRKLPALPALSNRIITHISNANEIKLSYLNDCIVRLRKQINDFRPVCQSKRGTKQREHIQSRLALLAKNLQEIDEVFDGLIDAYLSETRHTNQDSEENATQTSSQFSEQSNNTDDEIFARQQGQEVLRAKKKNTKRIIKNRENKKETTQDTLTEYEQQFNANSIRIKRGDDENEVDPNLHSQLVETLLDIPGIDDQGYRTALLSTLPVIDLPRSPNPFIDISNIVWYLSKLYLSSGENALQIFLERAKSRVEGFAIHRRLEELQKQIATNRENKT